MKKIVLVRQGKNLKQRLYRFDVMTFGGAALCAASLLLSWCHVGPTSIAVYRTDGLWAALAGMAAGILLVIEFRKGLLSQRCCVTAIVAGSISLAITILGLINLMSAGKEEPDNPFAAMIANAIDPGLGVFTLFIGSFALLCGGLAVIGRNKWPWADWFNHRLEEIDTNPRV
jgi:hypothetical protein